jgi:hypothetical protein
MASQTLPSLFFLATIEDYNHGEDKTKIFPTIREASEFLKKEITEYWNPSINGEKDEGYVDALERCSELELTRFGDTVSFSFSDIGIHCTLFTHHTLLDSVVKNVEKIGTVLHNLPPRTCGCGCAAP